MMGDILQYLLSIISIHLMLLLNKNEHRYNKDKKHFNTSYVVIKRLDFLYLANSETDFNTSYVVIKLVVHIFSNSMSLFQYILCCY